jgi:hypothetical protein
MKSSGLVFATAFFLLTPFAGKAQTTGRVECPRSDGYIYLYSSMTTLDVRTTLQCGELVQLTGRYDAYYGARTSKGEVGYVPIANIVPLKDQVGTALPGLSAPPARERTPYDERPAPPPPAPHPAPGFALAKDTHVQLRLLKPLSSATAHTGDPVEFEVLEDVAVQGVLIIPRGAKATGAVAEVEAKKHFGRDGKVSFNITSVHLTDNQNVPLRGYFEAFGSPATSSSVGVSFSSGKDALFAQGAEFTARVDGDFPLQRDAFVASPTKGPPEPATTNSRQPQL